jgi:PKD repeat protein
MSLTTLISASNHKPCYVVYVDGAPYYGVTQIEWERSFDQNAATCRVYTPTHYNFNPSAVSQIEIHEGYNGYMARTFTGFADDVDDERFPDKFGLVFRDVLKKAIDTWLDDTGKTYTNTQAHTAVADLLAYAGLGVNAGNTNFTIGDVEPAKFKLVSIMDAVLQIGALIGWHVWATKDGTVQFQYKKPLPAASTLWTYTEGVDILKFKYTKTDRNLRNRAVVIGYNDIKATAQQGSPFVPTPPTYRTAIMASELIDTQSMANALSAWLVGDLNHLTESIEMDVVGNPLLDVGHTVRVNFTSGRGASGNYFVFGIRSRMDGETGEYVMTLTLVGGNSSPVDWTDIGEAKNPVASFTYDQVEWGDPAYVLYVDGSSSSCPVGTITDWAWDWGDSTSAGSGQYASHRYTNPGTYTVTLTVTCNHSKTASISKDIAIGDPTDAGYIYKVIYAGSDAGVWCSPDSGLTWNFAATPSAVNFIASDVVDEEGVVLAGCASGALYQVNDYAATDNTLLTTFGSAINSVSIDMQDTDHWLVGLASGALMETFDAGTTWTTLKTFAGAVTRYAFADPSSPAHLIAPSNTAVNESNDAGGSWVDKLANWSNGTMTGVVAIAWHLFQHIVAAVTGGTARLGYSGDGGASWTSGNITSGTPTCVSGGAHNAGDFVAGFASQNYLQITTDGVTWAAGGTFIGLAQANDARYDWKLLRTIIAGG